MLRRRKNQRPKPPVGDVRDPDSLFHHLQRYLTYLTEKNYSMHTVRTRDNYLRYFIVWCDERGLTRPKQLDKPILERYQRHLFYHRKADGDPLSTSTQHARIIPIRHWLQWLVKEGHLLYSPAMNLELPRMEHRLPKAVLTQKEAEAVLAIPDVGSTVGLRDRAMLETLYSTGMRRLELIGLKIHDVDFDRGTVMIRQGKGKKDRLIPVGDRALAWLAAYRDRGRPDLVTGRDQGELFLTELGEEIRPHHLTRLTQIYVDKANLGKRGSCHLWRHTMATLMLEGGADIRFIQAMLGHACLTTTQIYTQVSIRQLKAIHAATHPGRLPDAVRKKLEADPEPTAEDLMAQLDLEADEEDE
jgi:integrase/recombinase XerD